jgi:hypothetical protein
MRAYPAKAKNRKPAACRTPSAVAGVPGSAAVGPAWVVPMTTTTASASSDTTTSTRVRRAVRVMPTVFTAVSAMTAAIATGFCHGSGTT